MQEIRELFKQQRIFFKTNQTENYHFRRRHLLRLKRIIKENEQELMNALYSDLHKANTEAFLTELAVVYEELDYQIRHLKNNMSLKRAKTPLYLFKAKSFIKRDPYGQVLIVGPFNYPVQLVLMPIIAALATGNTAIIKPSELSYHTSTLLRAMINDNFKKEHLYVTSFDNGKYDLQELLTLDFDLIFFTGSQQVGQIVLEKAALNLTPVILELGGKSPCIVDKDANLTMSAKRIIWGKLTNAGQTCIAPDYLLLHEAIKDEFIKRLISEIKKQYGNEAFYSSDYGRIINEKSFLRLEAYLNENQIIYGGSTIKDELYIEPTLIEVTNLKSKIMQEEIFGPMLPIITFSSLDDELVKLADKDKPLVIYYFGKDKANFIKIINQSRSGAIIFNDTLIHAGNKNLPFGGVQKSGIATYHGQYSYFSFTNSKAIMSRSNLIEFPFRYAPYKNNLRILQRFFK
ncbi:aldehyde dehydrogenase family protein [Erysipelotrichaceae bacterium OttesenSCG-928-M19]|nr:aldehyde dehydrogenase family protein [Erysipelotrichaceae bacterium OttesenSCG-928-M19]